MNKTVILTIIVVLISASFAYSAPHDEIKGTWVSDIMTVIIDFDKGIYKGVAIGEAFSRKLTLMDEFANIVIFKAGENTITAQIMRDGSIMLTKNGGIPVILERHE